MTENDHATVDTHQAQEQQSPEEGFVVAWALNFLTVLDDYLTEETKATFLRECAATHYQSANMDELVSQYRGNIDEFLSYVED